MTGSLPPEIGASSGRGSSPPPRPERAGGRPGAPSSSARWFLRVLRAFARREVKMVSGYRVAFLVRGVAFVFSVLALTFLSRLVGAAANPHLQAYGGDYLAFAVIGLVVMDLQQVGVTSLAQRVRTAQILGILEAELASPAPSWIVLGVGPVYEFGVALLRAAAYLVLAGAVLGVKFPHANLWALLVGGPLVLAAFVGLGLLSAAATMVVRRSNPVAVFLASMSLLLSGVAYPVSVLPAPLRLLGQALPLTHALALARGALLRGQGPSELRGPLIAMAVFAGILVPAGVGMFVFALRRARSDGSLTHY